MLWRPSGTFPYYQNAFPEGAYGPDPNRPSYHRPTSTIKRWTECTIFAVVCIKSFVKDERILIYYAAELLTHFT